MTKYRVKLGHHAVNGKICGVGDTFESERADLANADDARFFEKVEAAVVEKAEAAVVEKVEAPKRGRKAKVVSAAAETGEAAPEDASTNIN